MKISFENNPDCAAFANAMLKILEPGYVWTMTITRERSGDSSVRFAIEGSSEDIGLLKENGSSSMQRNT